MSNSTSRPAICLTAGAALGLAGVVLMPRLVGSQIENLEVIAAHSGRFLAASALTFVSAILLAVGFALVGGEMARGGHRRASVLLILGSVGWLLHTAVIAVNAVMSELASSTARAEMAELADQIFEGPVFVGLLIPMMLATVIGMIGTGIVLWRTGRAPIWVGAVIAIALFLDFVTPEQLSGIPMFALLTVAFGALAARKPLGSTARSDAILASQGQ
ncbi:MAG TPA: hypothetical protein VFX61_10855 [Micromonosporaceae bacterium]|nr:hypothetical protein [Micromonosporaceae bacterium]